MFGTQENTYWLYSCEHKRPDIETGPKTRIEKYIRVRMPWRRHMYDIFSDTLVYCRPQFSVYWYKPARSALVIRFGWSPGIERA
jgi:hypothetical protein